MVVIRRETKVLKHSTKEMFKVYFPPKYYIDNL